VAEAAEVVAAPTDEQLAPVSDAAAAPISAQ
jgi:hypothetical protein